MIQITTRLRPAIAMIELIFALVIMGITLLSAPLLLRQSIQSSNTAMQQESIAAASSQLSLILTYPWDEGNTDGATGYGILDTAGDTDLNTTNRWLMDRAFNNSTPGFTTVPTTKANFTADTAGNDLDDFDNKTTHVTLYNNAETSSLALNQGEYLKGAQFDIDSTVDYIDDARNYTNNPVTFNTPFTAPPPGSTSTNIKSISVTLTNTTGISEHNQSVMLRAFASNIGDGTLTNILVSDATR